MAWEGSDRTFRLPSNWKLLRVHVLKRDNFQCQVLLPSGRRCLDVATEVDHIVAGDDHSPGNLRSICKAHHSRKSGQEGQQAMAKKRKAINERFRRTETHPSCM